MLDSAPPPGPGGPRRFYHGRVIALVVAISLTAMALVDSVFDGRVTRWTVATALGAAALILAWFYLVRFPKLRRRQR